MGSRLGPTCTDGDRMGCGVDFSAGSSSGYVNVFFTKKGKQVSWEGEEEREERRGGRGDDEEEGEKEAGENLNCQLC